MGKKSPGEQKTYALIVHKNEQTMSLAPLQSQYNFNLRYTPWQDDESILEQEYNQISMGEGKTDLVNSKDDDDEEGLFEEELDTPDPDNPFDYRHFLKNFTQKAQDSPATPAAIPKALERIKDSRPQQRTRPASSAAPTPRPKASVGKPLPKVRVQRRASVKQSVPEQSTADDDGLTIEFDIDSKSRKKRFLGTPLSGRPVSLRSITASGSPAGFAASPLSQVNASEADDGYMNDLEIQENRHRDRNDAAEEDDDQEQDEEDDQDMDVDDLQLASPSEETARLDYSNSLDVNDEALEAELALALELADEDDADLENQHDITLVGSDVPPMVEQESESESEEE